MSTNPVIEDSEIELLLSPETELEKRIINIPFFRQGLLWGTPRYGHPEGQIVNHILEVYENIDKLNIDSTTRSKLRIIALVHDTFKFVEDKSRPRDWSKHHGILARNFLSNLYDDEEVLDIIELHDEAYYIWRQYKLYNSPEKSQKRMQRLMDRIGDNIQLYYLFFKCDTSTGDKIQAPVIWFEKNIKQISIISL